MKAYYNYGNTTRKAVAIVMAVLYMVLIASVSRLGRLEAAPLFHGASVLGILTALQFLIALLMVAIDYEIGGALAMTVVAISTIISIIPILIMNSLNPLPGVLNNIACLIAVFTIRQQIGNERRKSFADDLTGIGNRKRLMQYINYLINTKTPFYLILLDLDHFKNLNDAMGHSNGDGLLKELAQRWSDIYPNSAVIGRLGGDEFLVVIKKKNCNDIEVPVKQYIEVVEKIAKEPHSICPTLTVSTGIVEYPEYGEEVDVLLKKVDVSVRKAQNAGRNLFMRYQDEFDQEVVHDRYVEKRIKEALDNDLFYMVYQPQFEANTKTLRGFESLIRMKPGDDKPIYPGDFIPVAEKTNLIIDIGEFVVKKVMTDFVDVIKKNPKLVVSVNISAKQLLEVGFIDSLKTALESTGYNPENLEIEITEYCMMDTAEVALEVISEIKSMGIKIAMDDFGTGFSSLSYLAKMPIDLLKIDKSLVDDMGSGEIIEAICSMSHALDCEVIAEGVEEESQLALLKEKSCNYIQGYIWSTPLDYEDAIKLVE